MALFVGVDVGTQGVRAVCADSGGVVIADSGVAFGADISVARLPSGWHEQRPRLWVGCVEQVLAELTADMRRCGADVRDVMAIAVDSTSGTVLPVDSGGNALRPAIMYNDARAAQQSDICNQKGAAFCQKLGYRFSSSFALPKIMWMLQNEPDIIAKTHKILHAADYIAASMTGNFDVSDFSNALKTGYDLEELAWPKFIFDDLQVPEQLLPRVVTPGEQIGVVRREFSELTGIPEGCAVVAGVTDGTAGFFASGASKVGDWNTTLGTTLVLRGISDRLIADRQGRIYCHLSPDGMWLPGAAGNVGGESLAKVFAGSDFKEMDTCAIRLSPTGISVYPLVRKGERFPFVDPDAQGFVSAENPSPDVLYTAYLEGVAYVERWCYETAESLGALVGEPVYTTGGGAKSPQWMQIRADVLNRELVRPANAESAMGAAIIAASRMHFGSCAEAVANMVTEGMRVSPRKDMVPAYNDGCLAFRAECASRGLGG